MDGLRQLQERLSAEVLTEVRDTDIGSDIGIFFKISVVETPVMGQIGAHQNHVPCLESLHIVSHELSALSFFKMYQFHFCMKMPAVVDIWNEIPSHAERVTG